MHAKESYACVFPEEQTWRTLLRKETGKSEKKKLKFVTEDGG